MKKHNEGYVLPLVLVVMIIMALIVVGVMSVSLRNLQTQKADIERMKDQYAAQGEIERAIAEINKELIADAVSNSSISAEGTRDNVTTAIQKAVEQVRSAEVISVTWDTEAEENSTCVVDLQANAGEIQITCKVKYQDVVVVDSGVKVNPVEPTYLAYEISAVEITSPETAETGVTE